MTFDPANATSPFLTTNRYFPNSEEEFFPTLDHTYMEIAQAVNARTIGIYSMSESLTGNLFVNPLDANDSVNSYRRTFDISAIAPGATDSFPHDIPTFARLVYLGGGVSTGLPDWRPVPYIGVAATDFISIRMDATRIYITNGATAPNIITGIIVIEYLYT